MTTVPSWRPGAVASADLAEGLRAAQALMKVPVPPWLAKQLANYTLRVSTELASRNLSPERPLADDSET
jgi:hypothetical protein